MFHILSRQRFLDKLFYQRLIFGFNSDIHSCFSNIIGNIGIGIEIPKISYQLYLDDLVPQTNFYRLLDKELDLHFLYKSTA